MKERDRKKFTELVAQARASGMSLTEAIQKAYFWLLQPSKKVWPKE